MSLAFIPLASCERSRADSPVDAYTAFSKAVQRGDSKAAYASLSQATQKVLEARAKEISSASGGAIKDDPAALAFSTAPRPDPLTEVKLVQQNGDRAVLAVSAGARYQKVGMVHENGGWKVDLSEKLSASDGAKTTTP